jgi:LPS-assembly lipoprotein
MAAHNLRCYLPFISDFDCVGKHIAVIVWAGLFVHVAGLHIDVDVVSRVFGRHGDSRHACILEACCVPVAFVALLGRAVYNSVMKNAVNLICILRHLAQVALALGVLGLSACGFALKGSSAPLPFKSVQLQAPGNSLLAADIISRLSSKGVALNTVTNSASPRIALLDEVRDKSVASTTTTGRVREFKLRQTVTVQVFGDAGQAWLEPVTLVQQRDFAYNDSQVLAKEIEEQALYQDMQQELVLAVMRRLDTLAKTPMPLAPTLIPTVLPTYLPTK